MPANSERHVNVVLGEILRARHPNWQDAVYAEQTRILKDASDNSPDIIVDGAVTPIAVETEFYPGSKVMEDAESRLGMRLALSGKRIEHSIACRLPSVLKLVPQSNLKEELEKSIFEFRILSSESGQEDYIWPENEFCEGNINDLIDCIDVVGLSESLVSRCTKILQEGIEEVQGNVEHCSEEFGEILCQEAGLQTNRMAAAIIANALFFHTRIEGQDNIKPLSQLIDENDVLIRSDVVPIWLWIVENVNYWPIFAIASRLLNCMNTIPCNRLLNHLNRAVQKLSELGAQNLNDLSGRVFQRLIVDRKFLATFYTLPVSATMLSEIIAERLDVDWSIPEEVTTLRIADWACGTGTLIGAMYQSILGRYRKHGDDRKIHAPMVEHAIYAFDIMPAATHLTSSTLAGLHAGVPFSKTKVVTMPYGEREGYSQPQIGSLELLADEGINPLFTLGRSVVGGDGETDGKISIGDGSVDVVIMNPPFTRPTNHERVTSGEGIPVPSFAGFGTSAKEQQAMAQRLKLLLKKHRSQGEVASHGNAGLGSNFFDLAHAKLVSGGVMALVLPFTFVQGDSWRKARLLLSKDYKDVIVISIATHGNEDRAFSADTGMAEVLVIATKKDAGDTSSSSVRFVNLFHRPFQQIEAMMLGRRIARKERTAGSEMVADNLEFGGFAAVRNVNSLSRTAMSLYRGQVELPHGVAIDVPMVKLGELGKRGLHVLDITGTEQHEGDAPRGPFMRRRLTRDDTYPEYPALWRHSAQQEKRLIVPVDSVCEPKPECYEHASRVWDSFASSLHISVDFQLNSQGLAACMTQENSIGGRAWPNFVTSDSSWERVIALWMNTTLGLVSFWWIATRSQQGRASVTVSRHTDLVSIDPRRLTTKQIDLINRLFSEFAQRDFLPANEAFRDETRIELDEAILCGVLGWPERALVEVALIRNQWCSEPSVHGGKSTRLQ